MYNLEQKTIFRIALLIVLMIGASNALFSQTKAEAEFPKFLILIETTSEGLKLTSQEGCAWKELTFTLNQDKPQAIDQFGMTSLNADIRTNDHSNFLFIIKKTKEGISLEGKRGTAWTNLKFSCQQGKCYQLIDFNGMTNKG